MPKNILLAGESWTSTATHIKGWDQFASVTHHRGADDFIRIVGNDEYRFDYLTCDVAAERFPLRERFVALKRDGLLVEPARVFEPLFFAPRRGLVGDPLGIVAAPIVGRWQRNPS